MIGQVFSHYRIVRELGAGGMGVVYLAHDTRLGRDVAIKILPAHMTGHPDRILRFEQEARATSALNHPNIVTLYDVGEAGEVRYIVTELVEGETLRERMTRSRPTLHEAVSIALQIAEGLAAAHRVGVVHRDIKPENVMLRRDGYVKVLDFGLAKLTERSPAPVSDDAPTAARLETTPGMVLGTVRYMSPEQALGTRITAASDIFSLGIVMYEMVAGRRPFGGATPTEVIVSIVRSDPPPLAEIVPGISPDYERIVTRALAKDAGQRHASAAELADELRRLKQRLEQQSDTPTSAHPATSIASPKRRVALAVALTVVLVVAGITAVVSQSWRSRDRVDTLAVLPFVNAGTDPNAEYLSDGITESLINSLAQLPELKVMSRNAVWRYKGRGASTIADSRTIGKELNVRALLMGQVAEHNGRLRVSAELIDTRDSSQIWGEQYDRSAKEVLSVQQEIAGSIVGELRIKLKGDDKRLLVRTATENGAAFDKYLKGRYHINRRSADSIRKGRDFFQEAVEEDPTYALAWSGLSDSYALLAAQSAIAPREAYPAALSAARKAIELDPALAEGHASLAHASLHTGDPDTAAREFARAIALKPDYVPAYQWQAEYFNGIGRRDQAFQANRKALALDPLDLASNGQLATLLIAERRYDEAEVQLRKTLEIDPHYFLAHRQLGLLHLQRNEFSEAIAAYQETIRLTDGNRGVGDVGLAYARAGRQEDARRVAAEMEQQSNDRYVSQLEIALIYAALGDRERTLASLSRLELDNAAEIAEAKRDPAFAFLRNDGRFIALGQGD